MVAARTYTVTQTWNQPARNWHAGVNTVVFKFGHATFHPTISSTVLIAKLPPKCIVLDSMIAGTNSAITAIQMVLRANDSDIGATITSAAFATPQRGLGLPLKISLSDDAANQYAILKAEVTTAGTATGTVSITGWVNYLVGATDLD
jgi:hypothetical protein